MVEPTIEATQAVELETKPTTSINFISTSVEMWIETRAKCLHLEAEILSASKGV